MQQWSNKMQIKKLNSRAIVPSKQVGNAGFDLAVQVPDICETTLDATTGKNSFKLFPNERKTFGTGLAIYLEDTKLVGLIASRSKLGTQKGIVVTQGFGTLDSNYQGELMISLHNLSDEPFVIEDGMLVAQLIVCKMPMVTHFTEVEAFTEGTERESTGINCEDLRVMIEPAYEEGDMV
jgi:dUTP pyrophosphatase